MQLQVEVSFPSVCVTSVKVALHSWSWLTLVITLNCEHSSIIMTSMYEQYSLFTVLICSRYLLGDCAVRNKSCLCFKFSSVNVDHLCISPQLENAGQMSTIVPLCDKHSFRQILQIISSSVSIPVWACYS